MSNSIVHLAKDTTYHFQNDEVGITFSDLMSSVNPIAIPKLQLLINEFIRGPKGLFIDDQEETLLMFNQASKDVTRYQQGFQIDHISLNQAAYLVLAAEADGFDIELRQEYVHQDI